ncbi:hypothetical protein TRVA0_001S10286 [Trichomonascus vanleenenianus]|uniref:uncharacterized protein n=1 Tax=Trichomonascus vanleenenianus TaxID=2268995 RepID=UPI003ECA10C9
MEDAKLAYLCLYNPELDAEGEELERQIVFYYSKDKEDTVHTQLRHIGLAQGIAEFSSIFSGGQAVSHLETARSRIVLTNVETSWWIVACVDFAVIPKESGAVEHSSREVSAAAMLISDINSAYKRWRLHHGSLESKLASLGRDGLIEDIGGWWNAWCNLWNVNMNGPGVLKIVPGVKFVNGQIQQTTLEAAEAMIDKEEGLVDMVVTRNDCSSTGGGESDGCVWRGRGVFSTESVIDLTNWVRDCLNCQDGSAFLEKNGFVYHLDQRVQKNLKARTSNQNFFASMPGMTQMSNMSNMIASATKDSVNNFLGLMKMRSMGNLFGSPRASSPESVGTAQTEQSAAVDISTDQQSEEHAIIDYDEAKFSIGLMKSDLEEEDNDDDSEANIEIKQVYLGIASNDDTHSNNNDDTHKTYNADTHKNSNGDKNNDKIDDNETSTTTADLQPFNIVVYQRDPFTFTLVYTKDCDRLNHKKTYLTLHRRLTSLSEPFYADLETKSAPSASQKASKFYYIVLDPAKETFQSSLPDIPTLPIMAELQEKDPAEAEEIILDRLEYIHVHQAIGQLLSVEGGPKSGGEEHEKFIRTAKNWWVYWTRIPEDDRQAIFVRRWTKSGKPPDKSNGLLGVLGKDAKNWLDGYKYYGKV